MRMPASFSLLFDKIIFPQAKLSFLGPSIHSNVTLMCICLELLKQVMAGYWYSDHCSVEILDNFSFPFTCVIFCQSHLKSATLTTACWSLKYLVWQTFCSPRVNQREVVWSVVERDTHIHTHTHTHTERESEREREREREREILF